LFDRVSLLSLATAPLVLIAMLGLIAPLSLAGGLLALMAPAAGAPLVSLASLLFDGVLAFIPPPIASIPTPTMLECVLFYALITLFAAPAPQTARGQRAKVVLAGASFIALIVSLSAGLLHGPEVAVLPTTSGQAFVIRKDDGTVMVRDTSPPAAWFQMEQRLVSNYLKLRRETKIDVLLVDPHDDPAIAKELSHQFAIGRIEPMQEYLRLGSIVFASTASVAADVVVYPDGIVTAYGRTFNLEKTGLIRIHEKDGRLEVIPLRMP
jgi:hypothetical protein